MLEGKFQFQLDALGEVLQDAHSLVKLIHGLNETNLVGNATAHGALLSDSKVGNSHKLRKGCLGFVEGLLHVSLE
jgi:hypothetical protein